jgi:hypothetical protein
MLVFVVVFVAVWLGVRAFVFFFKSNRNSDVLKAALSGAFIPIGWTIDKIVGDDSVLVAWDVNNRTPRLFSKWSYKTLR